MLSFKIIFFEKTITFIKDAEYIYIIDKRISDKKLDALNVKRNCTISINV